MHSNIKKNSIYAWFLACRIKTLTVPFSSVIAATCLAAFENHQLHWGLALNSLAVALLITIATNFINDGMDFYKGKDTTGRLGFQRMSQAGLIKPDHIYKAGIGLFILAEALSLPLFIYGGLPLILIIPLSILAGYCYTGGPYPLAYHGLGEVFVLLFYGWVLTGGVYYVQTQTYNLSTFILGTQMGLLATCIIAINNFRDIAEDTVTQKKTLAVRWGSKFARIEIIFCALFPFILNLYWLSYDQGSSFISPFLILPLGLILARNIYQHEPSSVFNQYFGRAAFLQLTFGLLLSLEFIWNS